MLDIPVLRTIPLFSRLSNDELAALRPRLKPREVRKNAIILKDGTQGSEMMLIVNGGVRVYRVGANGKEITLAQLSAGDFFGEIALLTGANRTGSVIATTRTALLEITREDFISHIRGYSGLPLALAQSLAERLSLASGRIADIALLDVPQRLLRTLEKMSTPNPSGKGRYVARRPTHQELADMVGSSREVVSRCLKSLEGNKQISVDGRVIYLLEQQKQ
jgi:CRP-like cAMP-binding protein